jgi:hypothetical protein
MDVMKAYLSGDEGGSAHLDGDPARPTRYALFHDVFRPPRLFYVDELDRSLRDAL